MIAAIFGPEAVVRVVDETPDVPRLVLRRLVARHAVLRGDRETAATQSGVASDIVADRVRHGCTGRAHPIRWIGRTARRQSLKDATGAVHRIAVRQTFHRAPDRAGDSRKAETR